MTKLFSKFIKDEGGATAIEYGLIAALVSVVMIGALVVLGPEIRNTFNDVQTNLASRAAL
jgi:pilus assembly protein Flp/PilA